MANIKITDLTAYTDAASTDVLLIVDISNNTTKKVSISTLLKATPLGLAAAPAIAIDGDPNTGFYSPGADQLSVSTAGVERVRFDANGQIEAVANGTAPAPVYTFTTDQTTGAYLPSASQYAIATNGSEGWRITGDKVSAYNQAAPAAVNATITLTVANLKTGIITSTSAVATDMTLPTGTNTEAGFTGIYTDMTFQWSVINTGPSLVRVLAGTAHTIVGSGSVATGTSGRFASRRTAANTFVTYRLS